MFFRHYYQMLYSIFSGQLADAAHAGFFQRQLMLAIFG